MAERAADDGAVDGVRHCEGDLGSGSTFVVAANVNWCSQRSVG